MNHSSIEIYLNSSYATAKLNPTDANGDTLLYNSDCLFYFKQAIEKPKGYNFALKIQSLAIPLSYTLIDAYNNRLDIRDHLNNTRNYTIPEGNYNVNTLRTTILTLINANFPNLQISFSSITNKYTFTNNNAFTLLATSTCFEFLGFVSGNDYPSVLNSLVSEIVVNFSGTSNMIYIDIPNISTFNLNSTTGTRTSIVKSIPVTSTIGSMLFWENYTDFEAYIQNDILNFFHIRLLQEDGKTPIDFKGQNWNITIEISFVPMENIQESNLMDFKEVYTKYVENLQKNQNQETKK